MILIEELRHMGMDSNLEFRVLKPWWDVFSEYLCIAMLMISLFSYTVQLTQDQIVCLPSPVTSPTPEAINCKHIQTYGKNFSQQPTLAIPVNPILLNVTSRKNNLDLYQYIFVNHYCYDRFVHWYAKWFTYLVLVHTLLFMLASNFWFKFPRTSSKIHQFVTTLAQCFDSPWTTRALSELTDERGDEHFVGWRKSTASKDHTERKMDDEESTGHNFSPSVKSNPDKKPPEHQSAPSILDKKEGEQAKALFEKVKKLRKHLEAGDLLYRMYVLQTLLKVLHFFFILIYTAILVQYISAVVRCYVPPELTGFNIYCCYHIIVYLLSKLALCYIVFVGVYGLLCIYCLYWLFHRPHKVYSFEPVILETGIEDIPDVNNDFAFLLHLVNQYDSLYSMRFAVFLSEFSENRLHQLNLNNEWTPKKLRAYLARNANNRLELHLSNLQGLPDTVFDITEIESLKLEEIENVILPLSLTKLVSLQELSLIFCKTKPQPAALNFLKERLKILHLSFVNLDKISSWVYSLKGLEELHLNSPLTETMKSSTLESFQELESLRVLFFRSNLTKIPPSVADVAVQLQKLCIHNEGVRLQALSILKKLTNLVTLELVACDFYRIPHAVFGLINLQELDLKDNKLTTIEEILSLQHCRLLLTLRLWHNKIRYIPDHISKLHSLETIDISWNKLSKLPSRLFYCTKLRHIDVSHNQLVSLPPEVNKPQGLQFLSVASNRLENLPEELFSCRKLRTLALGNNDLTHLSSNVSNLTHLTRLEIKGNRLEKLPPQIGDCPRLTTCGLIVEENLLDLLSPEIQSKLAKTIQS